MPNHKQHLLHDVTEMEGRGEERRRGGGEERRGEEGRAEERRGRRGEEGRGEEGEERRGRRGEEGRGEERRGGERTGGEGRETATYSMEFRMFLILATSHIYVWVFFTGNANKINNFQQQSCLYNTNLVYTCTLLHTKCM